MLLTYPEPKMLSIKAFFYFVCFTLTLSLSHGQQTVQTVWRCGECNQNDCLPFTMVVNQCSQICSPCTGTCATEYYILKAATNNTYTLSQYSAAGCNTLQFTHVVQPDSCQANTTQCSRVYLPSLPLDPAQVPALKDMQSAWGAKLGWQGDI